MKFSSLTRYHLISLISVYKIVCCRASSDCDLIVLEAENLPSAAIKEGIKGEIILLEPAPHRKEITARRNRIRPVDSGIRAVDRITHCDSRLAATHARL